ncbi:thiopurine S-methyltransferase-like isoform X1 [Amblyomma americanum]
MYGARERDGQDYWVAQWRNGGATWQQPGITKLLKQNIDVVLAGKRRAQVFLPLCGKAHELKWFHDMGYSVVGVEFVEECVIEYFQENGLEIEETMCPVINCKIIQTPNRHLRVFVCSIFDFNRKCTGLMDIVWDRSSFSALPEGDRPRYAKVIKSLLAPGFSYGLYTMYYDAPWFKLNPRSTTESDLEQLFGDVGRLVLVDTYTVTYDDFINGAPVTYCLWHLRQSHSSQRSKIN